MSRLAKRRTLLRCLGVVPSFDAAVSESHRRADKVFG